MRSNAQVSVQVIAESNRNQQLLPNTIVGLIGCVRSFVVAEERVVRIGSRTSFEESNCNENVFYCIYGGHARPIACTLIAVAIQRVLMRTPGHSNRLQ